MPKEHKYYGNRAAASLMLGLYERVVKDCEIAIELNKDFLKAYLRLAKAHLSLGNFDKAEENLTQLYLRDVRSTDVPNERTKIKLSKADPLEFPAKTTRPSYSVLQNHNLQTLNMDIMPSWEDALQEYIDIRN